MKTTFRALIVGFTLATSSATVLAGAYDDLIAAVYRDDTDTVIDLINRGMDVNSVDPAGNTLLHVAARNGNVRLLEILLKGKANPNARNRVGDSPLMLAAYNGKQPAIDFLLAAGAELNHTGWTPLHYAVFAEQAEMVSYLLLKGANVDARAPNEQTALMLAAKNGNLAIVKLLLNAKADAALIDQHGDTPLTLAQKNNNTELSKLFERLKTEKPVATTTEVPKLETPKVAAPKAEPSKIQPVKVEPSKVEATKPAESIKPVESKTTPVKAQDSGEYVSPPFQTEAAPGK